VGLVKKCIHVSQSRVGIVGPNGAGKSTLVKLLTVCGNNFMREITPSLLSKGETSPQEGVVYKHPSLRVGYVSQHATHHIGNDVWYQSPDVLLIR
jgi:elongation factor 3